MSKKSIKLDVDPTIIGKNMMICKDNSDFNKDIQKYLQPLENITEPPSVTCKPLPGFCIKTWTKPDGKKVFINICHTDKIPSPENISEEKLLSILNSEDLSNYRVPMSIGEPRTEKDKVGQPSTAYDVAINTKFLDKLQTSEVFHSFFIVVVLTGIQDKFQMEIETEKFIILKNKKCVGELQVHKIMKRDIKTCEPNSPLIEELSSQDLDLNKLVETESRELNDVRKSMKYQLKNKFTDSGVKYHIGEFYLDSLVSMNEVKVDVGEDRIIVEAKNQLVDIFVPFVINQKDVQAVLNQNTRVLTLKMSEVN